MRYDYVEIGTSCYDALVQDTNAGIGLSIEPIQEYLDMLPSREGCVKINAAVCPSDGNVDVFYVDMQDIQDNSLPYWVAGCNTVMNPHPTVAELLGSRGLLHLFKTRSVPCISVNSLFCQHSIESVGHLKIDVEGKDGEILLDWIKVSRERSVPLPQKITVENNGLDKTGLTSQLLRDLCKSEYRLSHRDGDNVILLKKNAPKRGLRVLFFVEANWAFASIHYELAKFAHERGHVFDVIDWHKSYTLESFRLLADYYDFIVTTPTPNEISILVNDYKIPYEKIVLIGHSELDIRKLSAENKLEELNKVAAFAVVSESLCSSAVSSFNISRVPEVLNLGINYKKFHSVPSESLCVVGYSAAKESYTPSGIEWKRSNIFDECVISSGLTSFKAVNISWLAMPNYYRRVDALISPSLFEGAGLPTMEAAAAGKLVIGTPVGHFPINAAAGCGIVAPLEETKFVEFVSKTLKYYADNSSAYREKCLSIQECAASLDWSKKIENWIELFESRL